ncbi:helix-turn-helix domain-containing protein [Micromonospora aurantiaca]|uniref:helix-turn-helix domain-containing protein n=1 Tax=Micromonospora aurantiaca (nom. illeg.) TaxID=47850 RepID=UPI001F078963|nr:helix-turn-helix transcriptional regulator [Micromonospora aurantiaca]
MHRLVTGTPERRSLPVLAALCDILELSPAELIVTSAANIAPCNAVSGAALAPVDLAMVRSRRARVRPGLMDHPCATTEQYERWFIRICARCGRRSSFTARWPDGHVRRTCHDRARPTCGPLLVKPLSPRRHTEPFSS